ncbi:gibberellin 2beta-dioxygenase [Trifolium repens]|nr:gibberellin 2-beta-dioxygenase [Trifolium repens]WJX68755.1 gibberellin 2beta-dioxygenase [Trifolium repens]
MDYEPPFLEKYKTLLQSTNILNDISNYRSSMVDKCEIPQIDLSRLNIGHLERKECMKEITEAAKKWGFFQVVNHGVSQEVIKSMQFEQMKVFRMPFGIKSQENFLNLPSRSYRWGNPSATNPKQLMWSEALHMFLPDIAKMDQHISLRSSVEDFVRAVIPLADTLVQILAEELNIKFSYFQHNCSANTCYLRLNRYPICPFPSKVVGLLPHEDSSFLTIVHQDHIGGLQLMKDGNWISVKPNSQALIVNIGDLFRALSNGMYTSVKHRVVAAEKVERFSVAFLYGPSIDAEIESYATPPLYKKFTLGEYQEQTLKDLKEGGEKVGLSRFLL